MFRSPSLAALLALVMMCLHPSGAAGDTVRESAAQFYDSIQGPGPHELSPVVQSVQADGFAYDAYPLRLLLRAGLAGDVQALAMAAVLTQDDPAYAPTPMDEIIVPWLVAHLGEGEAYWLLAVMHLNWIMGNTSLDDTAAMNQYDTYIRLSGMADHPKGLIFSFASGFHENPNFIVPSDKESKHPIPEYIYKYEKEGLYWLERAAEFNNSRANSILGVYYAINSPNRPLESATVMSIYYLEKALFVGYKNCGGLLKHLFREGIINQDDIYLKINIDCKRSFFYAALTARLYDDGLYLTDPQISPSGYDAEVYAQKFMTGYPDTDSGPCMTKDDYEAILKKSEEVYNSIMEKQKSQKLAQEALYAQARQGIRDLQAQLDNKGWLEGVY